MGDDGTIDLESTDGQTLRCRILDFPPFKEEEYVVLLNPETGDPVVTEHARQGGRDVFRQIEDDAEFEAVSSHVRESEEQAGERDTKPC